MLSVAASLPDDGLHLVTTFKYSKIKTRLLELTFDD